MPELLYILHCPHRNIVNNTVHWRVVGQVQEGNASDYLSAAFRCCEDLCHSLVLSILMADPSVLLRV